MQNKKTITIIALVLGILGLILSGNVIGLLLGMVAIILAIMGFLNERTGPLAFVSILLGIAAIVFFIGSLFIANLTKRLSGNPKAKTTQETNVESSQEEIPETTSSFDKKRPECEYVFCAYILDNAKNYDNKYISTEGPIKYIGSNNLNIEVEGFKPDISANGVEVEGLSEGDWVKISGRIDASYTYDVQFKDALVEKIERPSSFDDDMTNFFIEKHDALVKEREDFISSSKEVSYEDLRRYPDTYKGQPLKLTIKIKDVKPDGWVFQGDIFAYLNGEEIGVYDARGVREPRFLPGDKITVYATGNGLGKIQIKDGTGLFAKVIDEYEVPTIKIIYTDLDNLDNIKPSNDDPSGIDWDSKKSDASEKGKEAAEYINKMIGA
ncbi:MAG: hypothetical protein J6N21_10000 [Butyrivibrio sp.]|nr:hypothetical protein [Butyrivibrio sp.]